MAKKSKRPDKKATQRKKTSEPKKGSDLYLVPEFLEKYLQSPYAGAVFAAIYVVIILTIALQNYQIGPYFSVVTDFYWDYVPSAENFQQGIVNIDDYRGPGYPGALGLLGFVIPDLFTAGMVLAAVSGGFFLYLIFEIISKLFRRDVAIGVVLLTAVNPTFVKYSYNPGTDMFFAALVAAAFYFVIKSQQLDYKNLGIAALITAVAYLTRYNGLFIIGFVPIAILLFDIYKVSWVERLKSSALFVGLFFLFITPWGIHCLQEKGDFFYNKNYENIAYEVYAKGEMGWDEFWYGEGVDVNSLGEVIMKDPPRFIGNVLTNIPGHFMDDMEKLIGWELGWLPFAGLFGLLLAVATKNFFPDSRHLSFYLYFLLFFAVLLLVFHGPRFSLFLIPFYFLLGLQLFTYKEGFAAKLIPDFRYVPLLIVVLASLSYKNAYEENSEQMDTGTDHLLEIQQQFDRYISQEDRQGQSVAGRQPHIGYILGLDFQRLPHEQDYDRLMEELREREVDYLFLGMIELGRWQQLQFLANPNQAPDYLTPVASLPQIQNRPPIILYRIEY